MSSYNTFLAMKNFMARKILLTAKINLKFQMTIDDIVDTIALVFWPKNGPKEHIPIETFGKGNCGPRAMAHLLFGSQSRYLEVHVHCSFLLL